MKKFRLILSVVLALSLMVTNSAFVFGSYDGTARARPQLCDPHTDPEAVNVWKVSPERISLSYSGTTDTFSIDHWST